MTILENVRAKIIEAIPHEFARVTRGNEVLEVDNDAVIRLADVLRAIEPKRLAMRYMVDIEGRVWRWDSLDGKMVSMEKHWNLALPLDEQSDEVIEFLAKVLTN